VVKSVPQTCVTFTTRTMATLTQNTTTETTPVGVAAGVAMGVAAGVVKRKV